MSGGYQLIEVANSNSAGVSAGAGTTLTGGTAAYGAYVQLIASTPFDTSFVQVLYSMTTNAFGNNMYMTVAIGGAGSETPIISDFYLAYDTVGGIISLPLNIPASSRIAARMWDDGGADPMTVALNLYDSNLSGSEGYAGIESVVGVAPNITGNTASGVSGAYGNWAQVVASTKRDYAGLIPTVASASGQQLSPAVYEIGIGAGGSEVPIIVDQMAACLLTTPRASYPGQFIPIPIPAGTRLSYRSTVPGGTPKNVRMTLAGVF